MATETGTLADTAKVAYYSQGLRERFRLDAQKAISRTIDQAHYADIAYAVDPEKHRARTEAIVKSGGLERSVPDGWPRSVDGSLVWSSSDFVNEHDYVLLLSQEDKGELLKALEAFKKLGISLKFISRDNFPLFSLGQRLELASEDIYNGKGFAIVRGLDPDTFSVEDFTILYIGISTYIAESRGKQDQRGSMLMHVLEKEQASGTRETNDKPFHTDTVCDCLGLVTRECSAVGGRSIIASSWTVYNELAAVRPDILHVLAQPDWPFDTFGRDPAFFRRAVLYCSDGKPIFNFTRRLLLGSPPWNPRTPGIPGLNERQAEAIDTLHFLADKHSIAPTMERGDIRYINNMGLMHRREAFDPGSERHLVRLWLHNKAKCWPLPDPLKLAWARVFDDAERGEFWDLEPPRKHGKVLRVAVSCD